MSDDKTKLIVVKKTNGTSQAYQTDTSQMLDTFRTFLSSKHMMSINDSFLVGGGTAVDRLQESEIPLSSILDEKNTLLIGQPTDTSPIGIDDGVARYNLLNSDQKWAIFNNIQIFRGLTFTQDKFDKTYKDVYSWAPGYAPVANTPRVSTELISNYAFSKVMSELKIYSSNATSMNLSSPYASGEAEYKTEKSKTTTSSKVTEYLSTRYAVHKAKLEVNPQRLVVSPEFVAAVKRAIKDNESTVEGFHNLISVLNEFGYYVPVEFTLGGAILGTDETTIDDFSQADTQKQEFNASFKGEFEGIGGGVAYKEASGQDKTNSTSTKFQAITMRMIGGTEGLEKDYPKWADSLKPAINWSMTDVIKFWPTLVLLASDDEGRQALGTAINLIEQFVGNPNTQSVQPYLDLRAYNTSIQEIVNPFG